MHRRSRHGTIHPDTPARHARTDRQTNGEGRPRMSILSCTMALPPTENTLIPVPARHACPRVAWGPWSHPVWVRLSDWSHDDNGPRRPRRTSTEAFGGKQPLPPSLSPINSPRHQICRLSSAQHAALRPAEPAALVAIHSLPINGRETCALPPSPIELGRLSRITHTSNLLRNMYRGCVADCCSQIHWRRRTEIVVKSRSWHCRTAQAMFLTSFHRQSSNHERPTNDRVRFYAELNVRRICARHNYYEFHGARARAKKIKSPIARAPWTSRRQLEGATLLEGGLQPHYFGSFLHHPFAIGALVSCPASRISHPEIPLGPLASRQLNS